MAVGIALAVGAVGAACGDDGGAGDGGDTENVAETGYVSGSGTITTIPEADREDAPELSGTTLDDEELALDDLASEGVVLNVWGSWCPPCRKEAPELADAARTLEAEDVSFLGISSRDTDKSNAQAFERRFDLPYPSLYDPTGELLLGFRDTLPPNAIPSTLIIDADGRVAARIIGETTAATLVELTRDVLAGEAS